MNTERNTRTPRRSHGAVLGTMLALWIGHALPLAAASRPDETTLLAQAALAKRGFYFDTPDGQFGPSTTDAIRRFQIREGLPVTGKLDDATSRALNLAAGVTKPAAAPPRPVASTAADRDFLRQNGLSTGPAPSPIPGRAPTPKSPPVSARITGAPPPRPPVRGPEPAPTGDPNVFTSVPPRLVAPRITSGASAVTPGEAAGFLRRYLTAGAADNLAPEVSFFAREVDYFNNGRVSRRFVERDQTAYRRRWPFRRYQLEREPELVRVSPDGTAEVRYRLRYEVESPAKVASGRTEGEVRIRRVLGGGREDFEIVSVKERPL